MQLVLLKWDHKIKTKYTGLTYSEEIQHDKSYPQMVENGT